MSLRQSAGISASFSKRGLFLKYCLSIFHIVIPGIETVLCIGEFFLKCADGWNPWLAALYTLHTAYCYAIITITFGFMKICIYHFLILEYDGLSTESVRCLQSEPETSPTLALADNYKSLC